MSVDTRRLTIVVGARPNFVKAAPVIRELSRGDYGWQVRLVHTGQHYDERLSDLFFTQLAIPLPDVNLGIGSGSATQQTARAMMALEIDFATNRPDAVMVFGDINSTVAAALTAVRLGHPVIHVEAGLRSFDRTMPEEINRMVTDAISSLLFVTEPSGLENLAREGVDSARVHLVGNTMIDSLDTHQSAAARLQQAVRLGVTGRYVLVTLHRPSNVDADASLRAIVTMLVDVAREVPIIFPVHPRTRQRLEALGDSARLQVHGVRVVEPQGYLEFLNLMMHAAVVLTDSGGVQEETTALGVPCVTMRANTERPATIVFGTNVLAGDEPEAARRAVLRALEQSPPNESGRPPLWDGRAAVRIARYLSQWRTDAGSASHH